MVVLSHLTPHSKRPSGVDFVQHPLKAVDVGFLGQSFSLAFCGFRRSIDNLWTFQFYYIIAELVLRLVK